MCATLQIVVAHTKSAVTHPAARDDAGRDDDDGSKSSTGARARTIDDDDDAGAGNVRGRDHRR